MGVGQLVELGYGGRHSGTSCVTSSPTSFFKVAPPLVLDPPLNFALWLGRMFCASAGGLAASYEWLQVVRENRMGGVQAVEYGVTTN